MGRKAMSVQELLSTRYRELEFEGDWLDTIGRPELTGSWFIWGNSGNGKTRLALQLAKYMTNFGKVAYDSLEEGGCKSMADAIREVGIESSNRFQLLDMEQIEDLDARLEKRKSPDIIFIDSIQYARINGKKITTYEFKQLVEKHRHKLFIVISHASGKKPKGNVADDIHYHSSVKLWVEGFKAFPKSRYKGTEPFTIWPEGALEVWGN